MNNFLDFIEKDIDQKKTLITSMPTRTKTNKNKLNKTILEMEEKYKDYKVDVKNYLLVKSHSFDIKSDNSDLDKEKEKVISLEQVKFLLNNTNTYIEKLGFDELLFKINNYNMFNFDSLNEIINGFLDKFESIGVYLKADDFNYSNYVNEYMTAFLNVKYGKDKKYDKVSEVFERIYWLNPELINHIALNFRKLIRKYSKDFDSYIEKLQKNVRKENNIKDYSDCIKKLKIEYTKMEELEDESIDKIINLALEGEFDINHYMEDSKFRTSAYSSLIHDDVDIKDKKTMDKICEILSKFKYNILEYMNYIKFVPLFNLFKTDYKGLLENKEKEDNKFKDIESEIISKEKELDKYNHKVFGVKTSIFDIRNDSIIKNAKMKSNHLVRELSDLYKQYDEEYFKSKINNVISQDMTIEKVLHLYYSFDYFKKRDIQKAYETNEFNEIIDYASEFDLYSMNINNLIIKGVPIFHDTDISEIIANKYKLNNIKIEEDDLAEENLKSLYNKILLILRVNTIENSESSIDKIWFMVQVKKLMDQEKEENIEAE